MYCVHTTKPLILLHFCLCIDLFSPDHQIPLVWAITFYPSNSSLLRSSETTYCRIYLCFCACNLFLFAAFIKKVFIFSYISWNKHAILMTGSHCYSVVLRIDPNTTIKSPYSKARILALEISLYINIIIIPQRDINVLPM